MRVAIAGIGLLLFTTTAFAQAPPCAPPAFAYNPYKPSHLAIMREYGGAMLAHAPLSTLFALDPYVPSQAERLRQLGSGIPLWPMYPFYSYVPPPAPLAGVVSNCAPEPEPSSASAPPITQFAEVLTALQRERATGSTATATAGARGSRAERNAGVLIYYEGRAWVSAGGAVPFSDAEFVRIGESAGFPVFRRIGAKDDLIFVRSTPQMLAPFQAIR